MKYDRIVYLSVGKTNQNPLDLIDAARRQLDHFGRPGICAKRDQTDEKFAKDGFLRFVFPTKARRKAYLSRIEEHCSPAIRVQLKSVAADEHLPLEWS